jgi:SAM-dependent methyltransferase
MALCGACTVHVDGEAARAGDGTFAVALACIVGPSGRVFAIELDDERLAEIQQAARKARVSNITAIRGAVSTTNLPQGCCDAVFSRGTYRHLTDALAINADLFRALRPGGRLVTVDFEPGGIMDLDRSTGDRRSSRRAWDAKGNRDVGGDGCRIPCHARARIVARPHLRCGLQAALNKPVPIHVHFESVHMNLPSAVKRPVPPEIGPHLRRGSFLP